MKKSDGSNDCLQTDRPNQNGGMKGNLSRLQRSPEDDDDDDGDDDGGGGAASPTNTEKEQWISRCFLPAGH